MSDTKPKTNTPEPAAQVHPLVRWRRCGEIYFALGNERRWGMPLRKFPPFWDNNDLRSQARKLRLAVVQNVFDQAQITEAEAKEILSGRLDPDDENSVVDDSEYLDTATPTT